MMDDEAYAVVAETENESLAGAGTVPDNYTRDWRMFNVVILGVAFMLMFTAFQTSAMVEQTVLESVRAETNGSFSGTGYTSLAIIYGTFSIANWVAPPIIAMVGARVSMFFGGVIYTIFIVSFLKPMTWALYSGSVLLGFGAAVIWTAQGHFLILNSDTNTIGRNSGIFWAIFQSSLLFGNLYVYFAFQSDTISTQSRVQLFIVLAVTCSVGVLTIIFLRAPRPKADARLSSQSDEAVGPLQAFKKSFQLLTTKRMLLLSITFAYTGLELTFFSGVYATCVGHTQAFGTVVKSLIGMCGIFIGIGEIVGGAAFGMLGKRTARYGRDAIVLLGFVVHLVCFFLIFINLPFASPMRDTEDKGFLLTNKYVAVLCAFMLGFGDSAFNTQIYAIIGDTYAKDSAPAFALFKFVQSLAAAGAFFYSLHLLLQWQLLVLALLSAAGSLAFFAVEHDIHSARARL